MVPYISKAYLLQVPTLKPGDIDQLRESLEELQMYTGDKTPTEGLTYEALMKLHDQLEAQSIKDLSSWK